MPRPTPEHLEEHRRTGPIRLRCRGCNEGHDGILAIPAGWHAIEEIQSLEDSMTTYDGPDDPEPPKGYSVMDWETHDGFCPDCKED